MIKYNHPLHRVFRIFESFGNKNKYGNKYNNKVENSQSYGKKTKQNNIRIPHALTKVLLMHFQINYRL